MPSFAVYDLASPVLGAASSLLLVFVIVGAMVLILRAGLRFVLSRRFSARHHSSSVYGRYSRKAGFQRIAQFSSDELKANHVNGTVYGYGVAMEQGRRPYMEDRHLAVANVGSHARCFCTAYLTATAARGLRSTAPTTSPQTSQSRSTTSPPTLPRR